MNLENYTGTRFEDSNTTLLVPVFESVEAVLKKEFSLRLKKEINKKLLSDLKNYLQPLEILEQPSGHLCFKGSLKAILKCQEVIYSLQKNSECHQSRNKPRQSATPTEATNKDFSGKATSVLRNEILCTKIQENDQIICKLGVSDINNRKPNAYASHKKSNLVILRNINEFANSDSKIERLGSCVYSASKVAGSCANSDGIKVTHSISDFKFHPECPKQSQITGTVQANTDNSDLQQNANIVSSIDPDSQIKSDSLLQDKSNVTFSCSVCSFKCRRETQYTKHLNYHQQALSLIKASGGEVKRCGIVLQSSTEFNDHPSQHNLLPEEENILKTSKENLAEKFKCEVCGFCSRRRREYKLHLEIVHPITYICSQCTYKTTKKEHYVRHVRNVHENLRPYACNLCCLSFKRRDSLKQHQVVHLKSSDSALDARLKAPFRCKICEKVVRSAAYLREHMLTHSEQRSYLCEVCGASFKTRAVHRNHLRVVHSQELRAVCKHCRKTFATKFSLSRHMRHHGQSCLPSSSKKQITKQCSFEIKMSSDNWTHRILHSDSPSGSSPSLPTPTKEHIITISNPDSITTAIESGCSDKIFPSVYTESTLTSSENFGISIDSQIPYVIHSTEDINA